MPHSVVICGFDQSGKTWLMNRLAGKECEGYDQTIGVDFASKKIGQYPTAETFHFWSVGGMQFAGITRSYFTEAKVVLITCDLTVDIGKQKDAIELYLVKARENSVQHILFIGTKNDDKTVDKTKRDSFQQYAASLKLKTYYGSNNQEAIDRLFQVIKTLCLPRIVSKQKKTHKKDATVPSQSFFATLKTCFGLCGGKNDLQQDDVSKLLLQ